MTRHPDPRTAACRQVSTRAATAAGWALLAAVGVAGLASTAPATASARAAHGGVPTVEGVLAAGPQAQGVAAQPAVANAQTMVAMAASPTTVAYQSSSYATGDPDGRAAVAVRVAMAQIGLPYVWGGDGPAGGDAGFDCSGLTHYAYGVAGISLPRTAHTQFYASPRVQAGAPLQPGDLVFYGTLARVHHVGMYIGDGRMVNAPTFGEPVQTAYYRWLGDDYVGATRPAASSTASSSALPFIPEQAAPPAAAPEGTSDVFVAPRASLPGNLPAPGAVQVPEAQSAQAALAEQAQAGATTLPTTTTSTPAVALGGPNASGATASGSTGATTSTTSGTSAAAGTSTATATAPATSAASVPTTSVAAPTTTTVPPTTTTVPPTTTTVPPTTTTAPPSTTTPPPPTTTVAPTTTPPPTTTVPPTTTTAPPVAAPAVGTAPPAASTSAKPSPTPRSAITVGGVTTKLSATAAGADGLPSRVGVLARSGRPVVRVAAASAAVGSTVTLQIGAGAAATYTVASSGVLTTAEAASVVAGAPAGELVILAPTADGAWTVLTAI